MAEAGGRQVSLTREAARTFTAASRPGRDGRAARRGFMLPGCFPREWTRISVRRHEVASH